MILQLSTEPCSVHVQQQEGTGEVLLVLTNNDQRGTLAGSAKIKPDQIESLMLALSTMLDHARKIG